MLLLAGVPVPFLYLLLILNLVPFKREITIQKWKATMIEVGDL